jgi:hypothetical protein
LCSLLVEMLNMKSLNSDRGAPIASFGSQSWLRPVAW